MKALNEFEKYMKYHVRSIKTIDSYMYEIKHYIDHNPHYMEYGFEQVSLYLSEINTKYTSSKGRVSSAVNRKLAAIRWFYHFLIHAGFRSHHPLPNGYTIRGTKVFGNILSDLLTQDELNTWLKVVSSEKTRYADLHLRNQVMAGFMVYQALRSDEIYMLTPQNINLDQGTVHIIASLRGRERILQLHPSQLIPLYQYMKDIRKKMWPNLEDNDKLLISIRQSSTNTNTIYSFMLKYKLLFPGKSLTCSNIRKSVIHLWLNEQCISIEKVQYMAGHACPSSTEKVKVAIKSDEREYINKYHPLENWD